MNNNVFNSRAINIIDGLTDFIAASYRARQNTIKRIDSSSKMSLIPPPVTII